jgi:hypothetical protein
MRRATHGAPRGRTQRSSVVVLAHLDLQDLAETGRRQAEAEVGHIDGLAYHGNIDDYLVTPTVIAYLPSHEYTFFANAAVGQDVRKLELAIDLAHRSS